MKVTVNTCSGGNHVRVFNQSNAFLGVITSTVDEVDSSLNEPLVTQVSNFIDLYMLAHPSASWSTLKAAVEAEEF